MYFGAQMITEMTAENNRTATAGSGARLKRFIVKNIFQFLWYILRSLVISKANMAATEKMKINCITEIVSKIGTLTSIDK